MFGQNKVVGRKHFKSEERLLVTSMFYTLQGEGPFAGRPAVFIRLAHCNLKCTFCDTYFDSGEWMQLHDVAEHALKLNTVSGDDCILVITGGEPMLQPALVPLLVSAALYFDKVQIESNGLQLLDIPNSTYLVVSPKCTATGKSGHYLVPPKRVLDRANCLKFLITANSKSVYHTVPDWALDWHHKMRRPVYVSPMAEYTGYPILKDRDIGTLAKRSAAERVSFWEPGLLNLDKLRSNHEYAAVYALQHGLRLSLQMQLFASLP